ncbi:MAG: MarR family transcriptional regulator [Bacteroidia bacterium]
MSITNSSIPTSAPSSSQSDQSDVIRLENILIELNYAFRKHRDLIKQKYKISALEMELIKYVILNGAQKMKAISEAFHIKLSTLTSIIDKAEKQRILKRVNSKEDRRVVFLDTTKKGQSIFEEYSKFLRETAVTMQEYFDEDSFNYFVEGLESFTRYSLEESEAL